MKSHYYIVFLIFITSSLCKKSKSPIEQLPPETQSGANTFGCLVNGQVFKPGGAQFSGGSLQCNYQNLGNKPNGGYYLVLIARRNKEGGASQTTVGLFTDSLNINSGIKYSLRQRKMGNASGVYAGIGEIDSRTYDTQDTTYIGELNIKHLDTVNQIVCGTFWFDAVNVNGQKVEIREGRFDVRYTR